MSLQLTVDSVDRLTGYYKPGTGRITRAKKSRATASFELFDPTQAWKPDVGRPVTFGDAGVSFEGTIDSVKEKRLDNTDKVSYAVSCQDYAAVCDHRIVSRRYASTSTIAYIVQDINNNFLDGESFSTAHCATTEVLGSDLLFDFRTVTECFNTLADLDGSEWWILGHDIYFQKLATAPAAPFSITDTSENWRDLEVDYARSTSYRNRQYLRSRVPLQTGGLTENGTFNGTDFGIGTAFPITEDPAFYLDAVLQTVAQFGLNKISAAGIADGGTGYTAGDVLDVAGGTGGKVTVVTVSGGAVASTAIAEEGSGYSSGTAATTGGTGTGCTLSLTVHEHPEAGTWFWVMNGYGLTEGSDTPPDAGVDWVINYGGYISNVVLVTDEDEIAARQAIEGGSGKWDALDEESDVDTLATANDLAAAVLARSGKMPATIRYSTLVGGVDPGMVQPVSLGPNGIDADYYVSSVTSDALETVHGISDGHGGTTYFRHQVTLTNQIDQGSWIKFWENWYNKKTGSTQNSGSITPGGTDTKGSGPFQRTVLIKRIEVSSDASDHILTYGGIPGETSTLSRVAAVLRKTIAADLVVKFHIYYKGVDHVLGTFTVPSSQAVDVPKHWGATDFKSTTIPDLCPMWLEIVSGAGKVDKDGIVSFTLWWTNRTTGEPAVGLIWQGNYDSGTTYAKGDLVTASGGVYISLVESNAGNDPTSSPDDWALFLSGGADSFSDAAANTVFAGPTSGADDAPAFRALVADDIPAIPESGVTGLTADLAAKAAAARSISTTAPLTGGGDLSADRTFAISNFTGDSGSGGAKGAVPAPVSGDAAAGKFLKASGAWAVPAGDVPSTRAINTTAPLTGGGNLSADRTLAISDFTGDSGSGGAKGAVPAPASGDAAAGKYLKSDGSWAVPPGSGSGTVTHTGGALTSDLPVFGAGAADIKVGTKSGSTNQVMSAMGSFTSGNLVKSDASHNAVDAGGPPAASKTTASHKWLDSYDAATGLFTQTQPSESDLAFTDIATNDVSITKHGFAPKAPNDATKFLDGTGAYSVPPGGAIPVQQSGTLIGTEQKLNFIAGPGISLSIADDAANSRVNITITSTGGSAAASGLMPWQMIDGFNNAQVW